MFLKYFWNFESEIPDQAGFSMYGTGHLFMLLILIISSISLGEIYRRKETESRRSFERIFGLILLLLEILYNLRLILTGHMGVYVLPLHLCAISVFICVFGCFTGSSFIKQYMYYIGAPGALSALLFPDWVHYPLLNYYSLLSFTIHGMLVIYTYIQLRSKKFKPDLNGLIKSLLVLILIAVPIYFFDRKFSANYLFLMKPSPGSILVLLWDMAGNRGYLFSLLGLIILVELILYVPWLFKEHFL